MLEAGIITASADELLVFYRDAFGFEISARHDFPQGVVHRLRRGEARLKLFQPAGGAETPPRPDPWHRDAGFGYAALHVDDLTTLVARATAAGAVELVGPTRHRPGAQFALVADPQGNVWELLEEDA